MESASALFDRLSPEPDERAVLSAVYQPDGEAMTLRHASLLVGPEEMSHVAWGQWRVNSTESLSSRFEELSKLPPDIRVSNARAEDGTTLIAGRASMSVSDAEGLLAQVLETENVPAAGRLPEATAPLAAPDALLHVFPRLWTPVSQLAALAVRPVRGFMLPRANPLGELIVTDRWQVEGVTVYDGAWSPLGIAMPHTGHCVEPPPEGLLVGRLERRAWFDDVKGDGEFNLYELHVGLEPERVDIADLEVELEEWTDSGDLANSRRLLLGDLDIGSRVGQRRVVVALPTLGRGLAHEARLYDRDGVLLDRTQRAKLVERVIATGRFSTDSGATATQTFVAGEVLTPTVQQRLDRLDELEESYRALLEKGVEARVVRDRQTALTLSTITSRLPAVRSG